jgi:hypothetical protein
MRMNADGGSTWLRTSRTIGLMFALWLTATDSAVQAQDASSLRARYSELKNRLANNQFKRPLVLESRQTEGTLSGDIFALVDYPFATVQQALQSIDHWCDILILHLNVKRCKTNSGVSGSSLSLAVGKKYDQPAEQAYKLDFDYHLSANNSNYFQLRLHAEEGPFGTKNYRIQFQAAPVDARRSFIHMSYSSGYGFAAGLAMKAYLATLGRAKVGFSIVKHQADGGPVYIRNMLGLVERNTMRYYLAIDAYLLAYTLPASEQVERRIQTWYASTERYAAQLHEIDLSQYVEMKRNEIRRQRAE